MGQVLAVPVFGSGVVLEGSADAQRTDELSACDGYDIGARGQLVVASDVSTFAKASAGTGTGLSPIYGMEAVASPQAPILLFLGRLAATMKYATLFADGSTDAGGTIAASAPTAGFIATFASFPYVDPAAGKQRRIVLLNLGARSFEDPNDYPGLYVFSYDSAGPSYTVASISTYDALGTGTGGEFAGGTHGRAMAPRGIIAYNDHAFAWGWSATATAGDGPTRVMFSNIGNPLKWGLDPDANGIADGTVVESNRVFADSDAIEFGGSGEAIRGACVYAGKLWMGTNQGLHYLEGFGRESFLTNGANPIAKSRNVIGPHAMIEGPDRLLYGMSDEGLWRMNDGAIEPVGDRLRDFDTKSTGWWDLIWSDPAQTLLSYPGRTNQDLVWMRSDAAMKQVWVIIPHCNATAGYGIGTDTVVIKFHTETGGFTRQVFAGKLFTAGADLKRETVAPPQQFLVDSADAVHNVQRYAYKATLATSPALPSVLPDVTFGEYAPFGPDGVGVLRKRYLTLKWAAASALPIVFALTPTIDGEAFPTVKLSIQATTPGAPANGDFWLDTSGTDTNLGNGTAGAIVRAHAADFIFKQYVTTWAKWVNLPGGGQQGTRVSLPIAFDYARGTRFKVRALCTAAAGRFQLEGFGEKPAIVREAE